MGIHPFRQFVDVDEVFLEHAMHANFSSVFWKYQHIIQPCLYKKRRRHQRRSIEAIVLFKEDLAHYDSSKSGVIALTRALTNDVVIEGFKNQRENS